jgi:hypothetical protein
MARKTKAELNAEREAYQAQLLAEEIEAYPTLLLNTFERACKLGYELTVKGGMFQVRDRNSNVKWVMNTQRTRNDQDTLEALIYDVETEEKERAAQERRYQAKQLALSKLTKEEKELLGL